jgi:hypothetical protein
LMQSISISKKVVQSIVSNTRQNDVNWVGFWKNKPNPPRIEFTWVCANWIMNWCELFIDVNSNSYKNRINLYTNQIRCTVYSKCLFILIDDVYCIIHHLNRIIIKNYRTHHSRSCFKFRHHIIHELIHQKIVSNSSLRIKSNSLVLHQNEHSLYLRFSFNSNFKKSESFIMIITRLTWMTERLSI